MRQITPLSLISVLANLKGGTMVYLTSLTEVDVPFHYCLGKVQKFCRQSMQVGCSYVEKSVSSGVNTEPEVNFGRRKQIKERYNVKLTYYST